MNTKIHIIQHCYKENDTSPVQGGSGVVSKKNEHVIPAWLLVKYWSTARSYKTHFVFGDIFGKKEKTFISFS